VLKIIEEKRNERCRDIRTAIFVPHVYIS